MDAEKGQEPATGRGVKKKAIVATMRCGQKQVAGVTLYEYPLQGKTEQTGTAWDGKSQAQADYMSSYLP